LVVPGVGRGISRCDRPVSLGGAGGRRCARGPHGVGRNICSQSTSTDAETWGGRPRALQDRLRGRAREGIAEPSSMASLWDSWSASVSAGNASPDSALCGAAAGRTWLTRGAGARRRREASEESSARCAMLEEKFGGSVGSFPARPWPPGSRKAEERMVFCVGRWGSTPRGTMTRRNRVRWVFLVGGGTW